MKSLNIKSVIKWKIFDITLKIYLIYNFILLSILNKYLFNIYIYIYIL